MVRGVEWGRDSQASKGLFELEKLPNVAHASNNWKYEIAQKTKQHWQWLSWASLPNFIDGPCAARQGTKLSSICISTLWIGRFLAWIHWGYANLAQCASGLYTVFISQYIWFGRYAAFHLMWDPWGRRQWSHSQSGVNHEIFLGPCSTKTTRHVYSDGQSLRTSFEKNKDHIFPHPTVRTCLNKSTLRTLPQLEPPPPHQFFG